MPFEMDSTISIHAPREGGDIFIHRIFTQQLNFNPRPREGGDHLQNAHIIDQKDFNPRPPRGGRHIGVARSFLTGQISIHAPREGGDSMISLKMRLLIFQSTPPARGATTSY